MSKLVLTAFAAATLLGAPAFAQTSAPSTAMSTSTLTNAQIGNLWRASKLDGVNIYSSANEKIGEIDDVLIDHTGKAMAVVVDVGGFLGIGMHRVALKFEDVKFSDAPRSSADRTATTTTTTTTGAPAGAPPTTVSSESNVRGAAAGASNRMYPDHAVINMTKDQLKALPQVSYTR